MGYGDVKTVVVETKVENCEKGKVEVNSAFLITHMTLGNKSKTFMRRIESTCNSTSAYPDLWQAHAQTMLVLTEGLAELGVMEIDNVVLEFRTNADNVSNAIFKSGDFYEKGKKWTDKKSMDPTKQRIVQLALGVLHCLVKKFREFGGSVEVKNVKGFVKDTKVLEEFKKMTMLTSGLRAYNKVKIEKKVVIGSKADKKLIELAVENGYDTDSDRLFEAVLEKYKTEKQRRIKEAAKENAIHTSRFHKAR